MVQGHLQKIYQSPKTKAKTTTRTRSSRAHRCPTRRRRCVQKPNSAERQALSAPTNPGGARPIKSHTLVRCRQSASTPGLQRRTRTGVELAQHHHAILADEGHHHDSVQRIPLPCDQFHSNRANGVDDRGRCQTACIDSVRIDQWLQAVRTTKTRSGAAAACRGGHVRIDGAAARPSSPVRVGDHVEARVNQRERIVDVTKLITKRVDAATAVECFDDRSPPPPERDDTFQPPFAVRDRGAGRPTKRDRRKIDRVRGR